MDKLAQFEEHLRDNDRKRRTRKSGRWNLGVLLRNANNRNFRVFVGIVEPANTPDTETHLRLRPGDMWYNRQILRASVNLPSRTTGHRLPRTGCLASVVLVTLLRRLSVLADYGRVVPRGLKIEGPTTLQRPQPKGAIGVYRCLVVYSDGHSEEVKPTWTVSENAPVSVRRMNTRVELTSTPQSQDRQMRLSARYLHPKLKTTFNTSQVIQVEGF